jgi:hypothetical protein
VSSNLTASASHRIFFGINRLRKFYQRLTTLKNHTRCNTKEAPVTWGFFCFYGFQMKPRSETLFHFMKEEKFLRSTLQHGFWPRFCREDVAWQGGGPFNLRYMAYPMVCFCDIPLSRIEEHVAFYGSYGIGMTKEWGIQNGLNPIVYSATKGNAFTHALREIFLHLARLKDENANAHAKRMALHFLSHMKPLRGNMFVAGREEEKEFYQESEWRFVPSVIRMIVYLSEEQYANQEVLDAAHQELFELALLKFTPKDVNYIFVKEEQDIPSIMRFIQDELIDLSEEERLRLMSRVTSLDLIQRDL